MNTIELSFKSKRVFTAGQLKWTKHFPENVKFLEENEESTS